MDSENMPRSRGSFDTFKRWLKRTSVFLFILISFALIFLLVWSIRGDTQSFFAPNPEQETQQVVALLKEVMLVPNETPFVAKIDNATTLKQEQSFYRNAKDGNYLIVYNSIARAIIFDARARKIINIGPIIRSDEGQ